MKLTKIFLNNNFILLFILINSVVIFIQENGYDSAGLQLLDIICTIIFLTEMLVKQATYGIRTYWKQGWNILDGSLVIIAIPSLISYFAPIGIYDFSTLIILRLLRIFRIFRVLHFFPNFSQIIKNIKLAIKESFSVFICFVLLVIIIAMINCSLFRDICPQYFGNPFESMYTIFRLCTIEGWYEIPDAVTIDMNDTYTHLVRLYFCGILFAGGIIGLSIVNSIFVDAMVSDNNDSVLQKLDKIEQEIKALKESK